MAVLPPLATIADLSARGIVVPAAMAAENLIDSASASIREAAMCAITQDTSTVTLVTDDRHWLDLPFGPVQSVASVTVAGAPVTGWTKVGDSLTLPDGWLAYPNCLPIEVTVTYTHGIATVPADIVDLTCGMVAMATVKAGGGYGAASRLVQFSSGGVTQSYNLATSVDSPSPFTLPDLLRARLRERFGGSVQIAGIRR